MTRAFHASDRTVLRLGGRDHRKFLQDLVTNAIDRIDAAPVYAALLTPQGKYLADFFVVSEGPQAILLDTDAAQAPGLVQRLTMYRLRADVTIEPTEFGVIQGTGDMPEGAWVDPREAGLGWRMITADVEAALAGLAPLDPDDWQGHRIALGVPAAGIDLIPNESFILEYGFDRLNGVDFQKGCYVGQEVTARMRHKTELRKGMVRARLEGDTAPGTLITNGEKTAGQVLSVHGNQALVYLRFDRARGPLSADNAQVVVLGEI